MTEEPQDSRTPLGDTVAVYPVLPIPYPGLFLPLEFLYPSLALVVHTVTLLIYKPFPALIIPNPPFNPFPLIQLLLWHINGTIPPVVIQIFLSSHHLRYSHFRHRHINTVVIQPPSPPQLQYARRPHRRPYGQIYLTDRGSRYNSQLLPGHRHTHRRPHQHLFLTRISTTRRLDLPLLL